MKIARLIYRKELSSFYNSPVAYITLIIFLLINGWFFSSSFFLIGQSDLRVLFNTVPIVYLFFVPAVTMGLLSRENQSGTMELLATFPVSDYQIVAGKFLAASALLGTGLIFTLIHFMTLMVTGTNWDAGALISGYLGLFLAGSAYVAVGVFGSAVSKNQITAFLISFIIIFFFFIIDKILLFLPGFMVPVFQYLSTGYHLANISRGVIDSRNLIYFLSMIMFFLMLSVRVLEIRKWR